MPETWPDGIAYFAFSCAMDADSCEACKKMDGFSFLRQHLRKFSVPIHNCTSAECRCQIFGIFKDESGADAIMKILTRLGGAASAAEIDKTGA